MGIKNNSSYSQVLVWTRLMFTKTHTPMNQKAISNVNLLYTHHEYTIKTLVLQHNYENNYISVLLMIT